LEHLYSEEEYREYNYKVLAKTDNYSDGEENITRLTNNILVTERSIPLWVRKLKEKYTFENHKSNTS
jgi:hypothetical protein